MSTINPHTRGCTQLPDAKYSGIVVIKSKGSGTIEWLSNQYPLLSFVHNPEFLTASTAFEDFHNQTYCIRQTQTSR